MRLVRSSFEVFYSSYIYQKIHQINDSGKRMRGGGGNFYFYISFIF